MDLDGDPSLIVPLWNIIALNIFDGMVQTKHPKHLISRTRVAGSHKMLWGIENK